MLAPPSGRRTAHVKAGSLKIAKQKVIHSGSVESGALGLLNWRSEAAHEQSAVSRNCLSRSGDTSSV